MSAPLKGINVLDFTTLLPGPFASQYLVNMGAEVTHVESPSRADLLAMLPPFVEQNGHQVGASFAALNRNKKSLKLDLKQKNAVEQIYELITEIDVVLEGFRPGVMARLGLGYEKLKELNPRLVYCAITGYGQTGELKDRAGHDINYLAVSGVSSYSGEHEPSLSAVQIADLAGGSLHAVIGIQAALFQRVQSGKGQFIDISMTDCAFALNGIAGANALASNQSPGYSTELLNGGSFYGYYPTKDNRWLAVGSLEPKFFTRLCQLIDQPDWINRFVDINNFKSLKQDLVSVFKQKPFQEWIDIFAGEDVCIEPVLNVIEAANHPHFKQREMVKNGYIQFPIKFIDD